MKIVVISTLWERTPPRLYGGTERIASYLTEELVRRGHDVTLFATGDSKTRAKLKTVYPRALYRDGVPWSSYHDHLLLYGQALAHAEKIRADIVHAHSVYYSLPFSEIADVPVVSTIHGNIVRSLIPAHKYRFLTAYPRAPLVSISNSQRKIRSLNYVGTVYNGIPVDRYRFSPKGGDYLFWMGRFTEKKGAAEAVQIARKTGQRLLMAGKVDWAVPADVAYFQTKVHPYLKKGKIEFLGEADHKMKNRLMSRARLLLNPISWDEPFGLVPVEANATGTPVVSFRRGALAELIEPGVNGQLIKPDDLTAMTDAVEQIYAMPQAQYRRLREQSRQHVERYFTIERMVDGYEKVYHKVIRGFDRKKR